MSCPTGWTHRHQERKKNGRGNKQRLVIPCRLPNTDTYKDRQRTDKRSNARSTSINQWKCGVRGVEPQRRPARTPQAENDSRVIRGTNGLQFYATAQPRWLPTNDGNRPRGSVWNQKVSTKPSAIQKIHHRGGSPKKSDLHDGSTSIPVPTGGPVNRIWTSFCDLYATEYF